MAILLPLALSGKQLSLTQLESIQAQLQTEQDPVVLTKLYVLLINNAVNYQTKKEEIEYRQKLHQSLMDKKDLRSEYSANLFQLATVYYQNGSLQEAWDHFEILFNTLSRTETKLRNLALQHLSVISSQLNNKPLEEKYLSLYVVSLGKVSSFYETSGGYEKLFQLASQNRSGKEGYYFEQWYQSALQNGDVKDRKSVLTQWVNYVTQTKTFFSPQPFDLLEELLTEQNEQDEVQELRRLYAQNTSDEAKRIELFEKIHQYNQDQKKPTELGILTRLYQSYHSSKQQENEQSVLEILAQRSDYEKRDEALKQIAILSQKNQNWILALNTHQKLLTLYPLDKDKEGVLILDNLISIAQKLLKDDLVLEYLKKKALTKSAFIQDESRHKSFVLALEIYRQKLDYDSAVQLYREMGSAPFHVSPYLQMYEIHLLGATAIEDKGDFENSIKTYQLALDTLLKTEQSDLAQAIKIAQWILLLTENYFPGEREIDVLKQINEFHKRSLNQVDQAKTELIIAQKLEKLRDQEGALDFYNQALESYRKINDGKMVSQLLTMLTNLEEGTSGKKLIRLQELESTLEKSANAKQLIITRIEIGNYYKSQGDPENAITYYLKAGTADDGKNNIQSAQAFYYAGLLLAEAGDMSRSNDVYQKALVKKSTTSKNSDAVTQTQQTDEELGVFARLHQAYAKNLDQQQESSKALEQVNIALQYKLEGLRESLIEIKATILINSNHFKDAELTIEDHLKGMQGSLRLTVLLAKAQLGSQNLDKALTTLEKALLSINIRQLTAEQYDILSLKSYTLSLKRNIGGAITNQEQLVKFIEQSDIKDRLGSANLDLSKYYLEIGRIPEALKANKQASGWVKENSEDYLKMLLNYAKINQKQGKNDVSLDYFDQLQAKINPDLQPGIAAEMYYQRGITNLNASLFENAFSNFKQAETSYIGLNQKQEVIQSKMAQANVLMSLGKIADSEKIYLSLLSETGSDQGTTGDVNNALAFLYSELGQYKKALKHSEEGEKSYKQANQQNRIPEVLNARGLIFLKMNDFDQAEVTFINANKQNEQYQNPLLDSEITNNLGGLYKQKGDLERAREQLMKTAELQKKLGFESLLALTYNNIASVYLDENKFDEALSYLRQSRTYAERFQLKKEIANSWNNEGILFFKQDKYDEAQKAFLEALKPQQELELKIDLARTHNNLSIIAAKQLNFKKALDLVQIAVSSLSLKTLDNTLFFPNPEQVSVLAPDLMKDSLQIKGAYLREMATKSQDSTEKIQYLNVSYQSYALAIELIESLRAQIKGEESQKKLLQANIEIFQQLIAILFELGNRAPRQGFHEKAFYYAEMSRARSFLDQLQEQVARSSLTLPQEIRDRENELKTKIANLDGLIFVELKKPQKERDGKKIEQWQIEKTTTLLEYRNFTKELEEKFPAYASLKYPKVYGVKETQTELLNDKSMLITYFVGADQSYAWAVAKNSSSMVALPPNADIDQLIRKYRKTLVNPLITPDEEDDELMIDSTQSHIANGLQIYRKILDPMLKDAGKQVNQLVIVPDGVLYYLPFETILTQIHPQTDERFPKGWEYLLHRYAIHYSPSVSVLGMIQTQVKNRNPEMMAKRRNFLGFGDPEYKPSEQQASKFIYNKTLKQQGFYELDRLFNTRIELREISAIFPKSSTTFLRESATESSVKNNIKGYKYIHFATHGILDERNPEFSGVVMNLVQSDTPEDGFLQSSEIFDLKLDSDLVVLSACETGLGKVIKGEGMVGLTRAFLFAGTPSIVVSLWTVADESTSRLMIYFYKYLSKGLPKDEALREARLELMVEKDGKQLRFSDPFYWGPFILNGTRI